MEARVNYPPGAGSSAGWVRPAQWLPMPTPAADEFDLLLAITNDDSNLIAFTVSGAAYFVDWGDGNGNQAYAAGATCYGPQQPVNFTNGSASIGWPGANALVAGQPVQLLTSGSLPTNFATGTTYYVSATGLTSTTFQLATTAAGTPIVAGSAGSGTQTAQVSYAFSTFDVGNTTLTSAGYKQAIIKVTPQSGNISTITLQVKHWALATSGLFVSQYIDSAFNNPNCTSLTIAGSTTSMGFLQRVNITAIGAITSFASMFSNCYSLQSVPLFNTASGTNFSNMFSNCYSLQSVPLFNTASGTTFASMFSNCYSLRAGALSGTRFNISYTSCLLSEKAIVAIFDALGNATAQTITVTGSYGDALLTAADLLFATSKGWTVAQ